MGRRIEKRLFNRKTRWVWDGNVPLHEWNEVYTKDFTEEKGEFYSMKPSKTTTWLFEEGTFVPNGKLVGEESFSIQSNYLGTPEVMYNAADGKVVWSAELDAYGDVRELTGERTDCPFRYQGQYEDRETGLYYNRFRYYSAEEGMYISQDPIKLLSNEFCFYAYVRDTNSWIDSFGLSKFSKKTKDKILAENKEHFGICKCEKCKVEVTKPERSQRGVTPPDTDWQTDHIVPDSWGGSNTENNGQVLCRKCNRGKSNDSDTDYRVREDNGNGC